MQAQKQQAEAGLAQTQANIDSLQSKKQELENYLSDLNTQYEDLTNAISELSIQAGEKENELKQLHTELKKAKKALNKQYDDMKLRIQYMYENGGTSALETLLSSKDLSEFLNNAESVAKISQYDRTMLEKCENLQNTIKDQETTAEEEKAAIDQLLEERAAKQQEVQNLAASTSDNISSYVSQISASQEEAAALTAEINNADNILILPGNKSPERLLASYLYNLSDVDPLWSKIADGYTKQFCFREYSMEQINAGGELGRQNAKKWFNSQLEYWGRNGCKVLNPFLSSISEEAQEFRTNFDNMIKQYIHD